MSQEHEERTTITVSKVFARIINTLARDAQMSAREYCDRVLTPKLKDKAKKAASRYAASFETGNPVA